MIRLNKYLAESGVCARRKADALIAAGEVTVDGRVARLGESIEPTRQSVHVHGRPVQRRAADHATIVLNKPAGVITTLRDERGRKSVASFLPASARYFPVGRLDANSTGVLLCTTDGELARILTHPSFGVEKVYRVRVTGVLTPQTRLSLDATHVRANADGTWSFDVTLREGRNRQVRRMCAQRGLRVSELTRTRFGPVELGSLRAGETRALSPSEKSALERLRFASQKRAAGQATE